MAINSGKALHFHLLFACLLGTALLVCSIACRNKVVKEVTLPPIIVVSGDVAGFITPCGCTTKQAGGLPRRASYLSVLQSTRQVLAFDVGGAAAGTSEYDRMKFRFIVRGEVRMGIVAHNIGASEANLGSNLLKELKENEQVPFISANFQGPDGELIAPAFAEVVTSAGRLAVVGVLSRSFNVPPGHRVIEPKQAILQTLKGLEGRYDTLLLLAYMEEAELREIALSLPEIDLIVGGPTGQTMRPERVGKVHLAAATGKGKYLVTFDQGQAVGWTGGVVEMNDQWPDELAQLANLATFRHDLASRAFEPSATGFADKNLFFPKEFVIAGSDSCLQCHVDDTECWKRSGHHEAWSSLEKVGLQVDPYCQRCHSTGYGTPGGFSGIADARQRGGVGCESCHGPSRIHVNNPKTKTPFNSNDQCANCHDHENSPAFEFSTYWPKIMHGHKRPTDQGVLKNHQPKNNHGQ